MTTKTITPEIAQEVVCRWAKHWLGDNPTEQSGWVLQRHLFVESLLKPVEPYLPDPGASIDFKSLPMFRRFDDDEQPAEYDDEKGKLLADAALNGDADAEAALCAIASRYLLFGGGRKMPLHLKAFVSAMLMLRFLESPKRRRGADSTANTGRNLFIIGAVRQLRLLGIRPTRNREPKNAKPSGCSIIAEALKQIGKPMTERAVEEVWAGRAKYPVPFE